MAGARRTLQIVFSVVEQGQPLPFDPASVAAAHRVTPLF
jgi:hypothetical protein